MYPRSRVLQESLHLGVTQLTITQHRTCTS